MDNNTIKTSLANQLATPVGSAKIQIEVSELVTTIKEYNAADLPIFFKWELGQNPWYYRVRQKDGKIVVDCLKDSYGQLEHNFSSVTSAFHKDNKVVTEDVWNNQMHKFQKSLQ